ncbi:MULTISPECIES: LysR family transcriptional regulator [Brucella]|uniref:Transcriptional regulator, LysR family n=1 Tax=Brucella anthropi (strain ATCC 49188 / DSM 6882 / CCUG 24695 / JCM 21032 / LMG 3331 / NBRC 15819 / NCTC 12168 / Alc 37) TaxID=439375 RepID=A6WVZ7_BRUA4|nr:LysR family transcriptional regulator [Brucella anthropi]ABS13151.1 transcriptional regulator, LysR family [Brucella anthropi ATCC 49188]KAB2763890.1 LysR family transcriptional regulator [Brucella anthropi]KAB2779609.1 LysR family transcriptional regulator [Brucella anthropi]QQC24606.1 LysR family transcriptional regulator [Brucella anthropi]RRY20810.1 LysR family transcriptional regulator [Brucella anthropi]
MNLRSFQAFVEVVRQGGFSAAAKTINATQSTVSKAVRQLEDELGLVLLDREISPSRLTTAGEIVFRRAVAMLAEKDDMLAELGELRGLKRGLLKLGLPPIGSSVLFAPVFAAYTKLYPEIDIQLVEHGSRRLEELLLAGDVELAASLLPVEDSFEWQDVRCEPVVALLSTDHALARGDGVSLQDIASLPFILFESGFALNHIILDACRSHGFSPNVAVRSSQIDFIVELVAAGMGIGFLPKMIAEQRHHPGVLIHRIKGADVNWNLALIWRKGAFLSHAARAWLELSKAGTGTASS